MLFFFLEYTGELHIISLIGGNKQINTTRPYTQTSFKITFAP
jgi:hypothetical protein